MSKILNTNNVSYPSQDNERITLTAVLVEGPVKDYAVYVGHGSPEYIAHHGNKLSFEESKNLLIGECAK